MYLKKSTIKGDIHPANFDFMSQRTHKQILNLISSAFPGNKAHTSVLFILCYD